MSLFKTTKLPCPACGTQVPFQAVNSVNADRRADLRAAIREGTFQRQECPKCGKPFRLDPQFNYLDVGRNQWIAVFPWAELERWRTLEGEVRQLHATAFGAQAPPAARDLGRNLRPRLVFGWPALWEKLAADEHGLDDVQLELFKLGLVRNLPESPLDLDTELRFIEVPEDGRGELALAWLDGETAEFVQGLRVPREVYEEVAKEPETWEALRGELEGTLFVDMKRLITVGV